MPAMGLADVEGEGDAARTGGVEVTGSSWEEAGAAVGGTGVLVVSGVEAAEETVMAGATGEPKTVINIKSNLKVFSSAIFFLKCSIARRKTD